MRGHNVIAVEPVLDLHLPVAVIAVAVGSGQNFHCAGLRLVHQDIDEIPRAGEVIDQRDDIGGEAGKNEATVAFHPGDRLKPEISAIECLRIAPDALIGDV